MKYLRLIFYCPIGFVCGIVNFLKANTRYIYLKNKYSQSIIDKGVSITDDTIIGVKSHILNNCIINHCNIGKYSYIGRGSLVQNTQIGNYCSIANEVNIGLGTHPINKFSTSPIFYKVNNTFNEKVVEENHFHDEYKKIVIGNDVWIGARAIILDGVKIGNGAIVATGAVVTKDVAPYAIVAGVPARLIKFRFDEKKINELKASKWWKKDPQQALKTSDSFNED